MVNPVTPTRQQLSRIVAGDQELLRALEALFRQAGTDTPADVATALDGAFRSEYLAEYLMETPPTTGLASGRIVFVSDVDDFPAPSGSVITLEAGVTYFITTVVDLNGLRLVAGQDTVLIGASSENCRLKSTGLTDPLVTSQWSLPMRHLTLEAAEMLDLDGGVNQATVALDWLGVNFRNGAIGRVANYSNFILGTCAFLNAWDLTLDGTFGTVGVENSIFVNALGTSCIVFDSGFEATRRFKMVESAVVAVGDGITRDPASVFPDEGFILETVNFSGAGTYLTGIDETSVLAFFKGCTGIVNTTNGGQYYMEGNTTPTPVATSGVPEKVQGVTTNSAVTQGFTHTDNRLTYARNKSRVFKASVTASFTAGSLNTISVYIAKNGTVISGAKSTVAAASGGRAENAMVQTLVQLEPSDYVEVFVSNDFAIVDVTVTELNMVLGEVS